MYDVILLTGMNDPSSVGVNGKFNCVRPLGAHKCAKELRSAGFKTLVIHHVNHYSNNELENLLKKIISPQTLFVGISNTFLSNKAVELIKPINNVVSLANSNCKIVVGGAETTYTDNYPGADYVVMGYADLSIVNLARHLKYGDALLNFKKSVYKFILIDDPIAEGFDFPNSKMEWQPDDLIMPKERVLPLEISRGCIFSCKFCNYRLNGKKNNDYLKTYDILKAELLENYEKYGITTYRLLDDTFNDNEYKLDQILSIVKELPFTPTFWAYIRLDMLTKHPRTIQKLVDIGVVQMTLGIETLNHATGKIIGKGYDPEAQVNTINYIKHTYGNKVLLFGHFIIGLPEESIDSVQRTMDRIANREILLDWWRFNTLHIKRRNVMTWESSFGIDFTKYGYIDDGGDDFPGSVKWRNNFMSIDDATKIANTYKQPPFGSGHVEFELYNLGFELENMRNGKMPSVQEIQTAFNNYISDYKLFVNQYIDTKELQ